MSYDEKCIFRSVSFPDGEKVSDYEMKLMDLDTEHLGIPVCIPRKNSCCIRQTAAVSSNTPLSAVTERLNVADVYLKISLKLCCGMIYVKQLIP